MTIDRAVELLRGMQSSIINGGRLRSAASSLDQSRVDAMDLAIDALRAQVGCVEGSAQEPAPGLQSAAPKSNSHNGAD
jgi:hypothetical protein